MGIYAIIDIVQLKIAGGRLNPRKGGEAYERV
jgi:hypothetical protein